MGEYQCPHCGHIITGFEQADFEAKRHELECLHAELARLRAELELAQRLEYMMPEIIAAYFSDNITAKSAKEHAHHLCAALRAAARTNKKPRHCCRGQLSVGEEPLRELC